MDPRCDISDVLSVTPLLGVLGSHFHCKGLTLPSWKGAPCSGMVSTPRWPRPCFLPLLCFSAAEAPPLALIGLESSCTLTWHKAEAQCYPDRKGRCPVPGPALWCPPPEVICSGPGARGKNSKSQRPGL